MIHQKRELILRRDIHINRITDLRGNNLGLHVYTILRTTVITKTSTILSLFKDRMSKLMLFPIIIIILTYHTLKVFHNKSNHFVNRMHLFALTFWCAYSFPLMSVMKFIVKKKDQPIILNSYSDSSFLNKI